MVLAAIDAGAASASAASGSNSEQAQTLAPELLTIGGLQALDGDEQVRDQLLADRADPSAVFARLRSRSAYRRLDGVAAARLVRRWLPAVTATAPTGLGHPSWGQRIGNYLSGNSARVTLPGGKRGVVESIAPIAVPVAHGRYAPVDLALRESGGGFAPVRSEARVSIPRSLSHGATLSTVGVSLTQVDVAGRPLHAKGQLDGAAILYANSQTDADTAVKATSLGFETYGLLRSTDSPTELSFRIGLPPGASVEPLDGGHGAVRVIAGGRTVALIPTPTAHDAAGTPVPVSTHLTGRTLHLEVAHRRGDYLYPIMVDPTVVDSDLLSYPNWRIEKGGEWGGANFWGFNEGSAGWVMYTDPTHVVNQWGALLYPTQGESHIYEMTMESSAADSTANVENKMVIFGESGWETNQTLATSYGRTATTVCVNSHAGCSSSSGTAGNVAGYWMNAIGSGTGGEVRIYTGSVYISQNNGPSVAVDTTSENVGSLKNAFYSGYGSVQWMGPKSSYLAQFNMGDPGVGVNEVTYTLPSTGGKWAYRSSCSGAQCPKSLTQGLTYFNSPPGSNLPEGEPTLEVKATNAMGGAANTSVKLRVDATAPYNITLTGLPEGAQLADADRAVKLKASATDGSGTPSAGVASMQLLVDGQPVGSPSGSCSPGPCTATAEWTVNAEEFGAGKHTFAVAATDAAGNVGTTETTVTVHHAAPMALGPGEVNPITGEFDLEETDVSIASSGRSLQLTRAYSSRDPQAGAGGSLGSPWSIGFGAAQSLVERPNGSVVLYDVSGRQSVFLSLGSGHYASPAGDASLVLTKTGSEFKLAEKGTTVGFAHVSGDVAGLWRPTISTGTAGTDATLYSYQLVGGTVEPLEALAPVPAGVSCSPELKAGCRALTFNYAASTTASGEGPSQWGDYTGQLTRVYFTGYDPQAKTMKTTTVAQYAYDAKGRLRAEWDPRVSPALKTTYGYDAEGHLAAVGPAGEEPWILSYGTTATDTSAGRLIAVTRPTASTGLGSGIAPANSVLPKVSGSTVVGVRLAVSDGSWSEAPLAYGYQWEDCNAAAGECKAIGGATNANYTPVTADVGHALAVVVTATNSGGAVAVASTATAPVTATAGNAPPSYTQSVDAPNSVNSVACVPGTSDCVIGDSKGSAFYATNVSASGPASWKAWSGPGVSPSEAVSCPATSLCLMAAGSLGGFGGSLYYATSLGGAWSLAYTPSYGVDAISCVSSSFCVDGQDNLGYFRYATAPASTSWILEDQGSAPMKAVSCLSSSFCAIADGAGSVHVATTTTQVESSSWTETKVDGTTALNGIACTSTTSCVAVDGVGNAVKLAISGTGGATATSHDIDGSTSLSAIACPSSSICVAVDGKGNVLVSTDGGETWSQALQLGGERLTSVSCSSTSLCVTADAAGKVTSFDPSLAQAIDPGNGLNAVSCVPGTSDCVATDSKGNAFFSTNVSASGGGSWAPWSGPGVSPSEAVSCPATSLCLMAAGSLGGFGGSLYYATSLGGAWSLAYTPSYGVDAISCVSSSFCVDGQDNFGYFRYSTTPASTSWTLEDQGSAAMKAVSCLSSSFCAIADSVGTVRVATTTAKVESSSWTETKVDGTTALNGIACTSTTSCVAVDGVGNAVKLAISGTGAATATSHDIDGSTSLSAIACPSSSTCVVVDAQGNALASKDGGETWSQVARPGGKLTSVSCSSASLCVTVDAAGNLTAFNPAGGATEEGEARSPQQRTTIEYGVPTSGAGAPYAMSSGEVAKWAQSDVPTQATAIFPPDEPVGWPAGDYRRASVYFLDSADRLVNSASPGGGIATTEYNSYGDAVRSLSPDNRVAALKEGAKSAEVAQTLDTQSVYGSEGTELLSTLGPLHTVKLRSGAQVQAREHTVYSYDEGAPRGGPYRLVTKVTDGAQVAGEPSDLDVRTAKTSYAGENNLGWLLHAPTAVTVDPSGLKLTSTAVYDPTSGDVIETRSPAAGAPGEEILNGYVYRSTFSSPGSGGGQLSKPGAITRDSSGNLWVADTANNRVEEFSSGGTFVEQFGALGTGNGQLKSPEGITLDRWGTVWVADTANNRIEHFASGGNYLSQFKAPVSQGEFKGPTAIVYSSTTEKLIVADTGNNRILEFTSEGSYYATFGSPGSGNGQFSKPEGLAVDSAGHIWVADTGNNRVQELSSTGTFMQSFGSLGSGDGQLSKPEGLAFDSEGDVLVADSGNSRVEVFSSTGSYMAKFGAVGTGEGNMKTPAGLALDGSDDAYVLDTGNGRVQQWAPASTIHEVGSTTGGTHGRQTVYYTTGANSQASACGNHPEWAGLPCETRPATQPETAGVPNLPVTIVTYNMWDEPLTSSETVGAATRTTTNTYDESGRALTKSVGSTVGTALPTVKAEYSTETGALVKQSATIEGGTRTLEETFDRLGRATSYKDADGNTSTASYDIDGRIETFNDGKGTQTYSYDPTSGLETKLVDSAAGTFAGAYDAEGNLVTVGYPNGMNAGRTYDATGTQTGVEYVKTTHCSSGCTWYSQTDTPSIHGQTLSQTGTLSSQSFAFDEAGRLTQVQDTPTGQGCTTRVYAYDEETNLVSLTSRPPGGEGKCASEGGTVVNHGYDPGNRLTDAGTAYDAFGDISQLPAADAGGSELTSTYYADETLASQSQGGQTIGYGLDPLGRPRLTVSTGNVNSTVTSHYSGTTDDPSWTEETTGKWTHDIAGLDGSLVAVQASGEAPILEIEDLHGDLVATASISETASSLLSTADTTEYGVPRTATPPKYSWQGAAQRATELPSGVIAMGARSYVPAMSRFLQPDPIEGGSANAYAYTFGDPIDTADPSGEFTVETPEWVNEFLSEEAEAATEAAIQRAAEEQAAREEAEEKAREAAAEAAEAAAEAAEGWSGGGGGGKKRRGGGGAHRAHPAGAPKLLFFSVGKIAKKAIKKVEKKKEKPGGPYKHAHPGLGGHSKSKKSKSKFAAEVAAGAAEKAQEEADQRHVEECVFAEREC